MVRERLARWLRPEVPLGRHQFWLFLASYAAVYAVAILIGRVSGWPVAPVFNLLFLWLLTRAGQRRLRDVGADTAMMWAFSLPFGFVQLVKVLSALAPWSVSRITESNIAVVPFCHIAAAAVAMVLAHYWIRPDGDVQA